MATTDTKTPEQLADERRRDVMAFAYRDTDGKLYTINEGGHRIEATAGTPALSPEYQHIAEQSAALMMTYDKILALNPEDRGILADLASGKRKLDNSVGDNIRNVWDSLKSAAGDSGLVPTIPGSGLVTGAVGAVGGAAAGFTFLPKFLSDLAGAGSDVLHQFGGGHISREDAIAIGTAYASARETAAAGRPAEPGIGDYFSGVFSKHWGAYLGAGAAFLLDTVVGFAEMIPGIGDWIKKQGWAKHETLAQHIEDWSRSGDNVQAQHEMEKLSSIGGRDTSELGILTRGGVARDGAGHEQAINPADRNNASPSDPNGTAAPQTPDAAAEHNRKTDKGLGERIANAAHNADFSSSSAAAKAAGVGGIVVGTAALGQVTVSSARRAHEGWTTARYGENNIHARNARHEQASVATHRNSANALDAHADNVEAGKSIKDRIRHPRSQNTEARTERADALREQAHEHRAKADHFESGNSPHAQGAAARAERVAASPQLQATLEKAAEKRAWYRIPSNTVGKLSNWAGHLFDKTVATASNLGNSVVETASNMASGIRSHLPWSGGKTAASATEAAHATGIVTTAEHVAAEAAEVAHVAKPGLIASGLIRASKAVGWIPKIGKPIAITLTGLAALGGGVALFTDNADAATPDVQPKRRNGFDTAANMIDKGNTAAVVVTTGATAVTMAGAGGASVAAVASAPVALAVAAVGGVGFILVDDLRGLARSERAKSIPGIDAQKLIAMVRPGVKYDDPTLDFISQLLKARQERSAHGQSLDIALTVDASRPAHERLQGIANRMSEKDLNQMNTMSINPETGGQAIRYQNSNIDAMLMEKAQYYLGDVSLKQAATELDRSEAAAKLGFIDSLRYNLLGDESVLHLPQPQVATTRPQQPLTNQELAAAHHEVIQQARMATAPGRSSAPQLAQLNLGMRASSTSIGSTLPAGSAPTPTPRAKQSGQVHANA